MAKYRGIIYKRVCKITGKVYIGQTINEQARQARWRSLKNCYTSKNSKIDNARNKYGIENFDYEILFTVVSNKKKVFRIKIVQKHLLSIFGCLSLTTKNGKNKGGKTINLSNRLFINIVQMDLNENPIKIWQNPKEIEEVLGFDRSSIVKCCKGKAKTHKGFIWKYLSDVNEDKIKQIN